MYESLRLFVDAKFAERRQYAQLTVIPHLVTIDGPDGSGKSSLSSEVASLLGDIHGEENVLLVSPTNVHGSVNQDRLSTLLHTASTPISSNRMNDIYVAGINRAYGDVIVPALHQGRIVVCDRSEVDLLRFVLESHNELSIDHRLQFVSDGTMTHGVWAGNRVFVSATPKELWENIQIRGAMSPYDPHSLDDAKRRLFYEEVSERMIENIPCRGTVTCVHVQNTRIEDTERRAQHLHQLASSVVKQLVL